ncbi:MAG: DNA polymerase III subunit gamma/tau, partial [Hyphomicrobiales bacterium]
ASPSSAARMPAGPTRPTVSLRVASSSSSGSVSALRRETPAQEAAAAPELSSFEDVIALAREKRDLALTYALERDVRLVSFERGRIEFEPSPGASDDLAKTMARRLLEWTGERWLIAVSPASGAQSIGERRDLDKKGALEEARASPLVRAILERFPGAEIVDIRDSLAAQEEEEDEMEAGDAGTGEEDDPFEFLDTLQDDDF